MKLGEGRVIRARVLDTEEGVAVLGVYVEGEWVRVRARTTVALTRGDWIRGHLRMGDDGQTVHFALQREDASPGDRSTASSSGLDLEA